MSLAVSGGMQYKHPTLYPGGRQGGFWTGFPLEVGLESPGRSGGLTKGSVDSCEALGGQRRWGSFNRRLLAACSLQELALGTLQRPGS